MPNDKSITELNNHLATDYDKVEHSGPSNVARSDDVKKSLAGYGQRKGLHNENIDTVVKDFLTDLQHFARLNDVDLEELFIQSLVAQDEKSEAGEF